MRALTVVVRNLTVYRHQWRGSIFSSFLQPTLFLLALGLGLGGLVDQGRPGLPGGAPFLQFLAPGLLAAACMQTATSESSWPVSDHIRWRDTYGAMLATPMRVADLVWGEMAWVALRLTMVSGVFLLVMTLFGAARWPAAALTLPAGVLTGLAFSGPVMAYAAANRRGDFNKLFRFVVTPLFLFSGTFFPVALLPAPLQAVAAATPLYHGVELVRGLGLGTLPPGAWLPHAAYLALLAASGALVATRVFRRRLVP